MTHLCWFSVYYFGQQTAADECQTKNRRTVRVIVRLVHILSGENISTQGKRQKNCNVIHGGKNDNVIHGESNGRIYKTVSRRQWRYVINFVRTCIRIDILIYCTVTLVYRNCKPYTRTCIDDGGCGCVSELMSA